MRGALARRLAMLLVVALTVLGLAPMRACPMVRASSPDVAIQASIAAPHCGMAADAPMACCPSQAVAPVPVVSALADDCPCLFSSVDLAPVRVELSPVAPVFALSARTFRFAFPRPIPRQGISAVLRVGSPDPPPRSDRGRAPPGASA